MANSFQIHVLGPDKYSVILVPSNIEYRIVFNNVSLNRNNRSGISYLLDHGVDHTKLGLYGIRGQEHCRHCRNRIPPSVIQSLTYQKFVSSLPDCSAMLSSVTICNTLIGIDEQERLARSTLHLYRNLGCILAEANSHNGEADHVDRTPLC